MASKKDLYFSVSPMIYKDAKSEGLMCQAEILSCMRRANNLKILHKQKEDLRKKMHRLLAIINSRINGIQEKIPEPKVPKDVDKFLEHDEEEVKPKKSTKTDQIEKELIEIQEKLRELNALG